MDTTLNLNIVKTEVAPCSLALKVEVLPPRVKKSFDEVIAMFSKQVKVPGFRAGKVPANVILKRFGADVVSETRSRLLDKAYSDAVKQEGLSVIGDPELGETAELAIGQDTPFTFEVKVEVVPEFQLPDYQGLKLTRKPFALDEAAIDNILKGLQERNTKYEVTDRPAAAGDLLRADFSATVPEGLQTTDKSKFLLGGTNTWLALKQPEMLPGVADALVGAVAGEERTVKVSFPQDHYNSELAGQTLDYKVKVNEVHAATVPALDDDLAKTVGAKDMAELRQRIADNMKAQADSEAEQSLADQALEQLVAAVDFPLPQKLLEKEKNRIAGSQYQAQLRKGVSKDDLEPRKPEILADAEKSAAKSIRTELLVQAISKAEGVNVSQEELYQAAAQLAEAQRTTVEELIKKDDSIVGRLVHSIMWKKTLDAIIAKADVSETEAPADAQN